jgi:hypothetical protein
MDISAWLRGLGLERYGARAGGHRRHAQPRAARLQALAEPNSLIVADATRRQVGALFEFEDLGTRRLAGFADPQHAWRVVAESGVVSRFEAALRSRATPSSGAGRSWTCCWSHGGRHHCRSEGGEGAARVARCLADETFGPQNLVGG